MTIPDSGSLMDNESLCLPCTPEEERKIVKEETEKAESSLKEGNLYYVISSRWYTKWQNHVGIETSEYEFTEVSTDKHAPEQTKTGERPGPIDNTDIISNDGGRELSDLQISRTLNEGTDYVLVPQGVWEKLHGWYKGGPALPRKMILLGVQGTPAVEVFPLSLKLVDSRDKSERIIHISKKATLRKLYEQVSALKGVHPEKIRIWDYFNNSKQMNLTDLDQTLEDSNLQMDQPILLELKDDGYLSSRFSMDSTGNELALVPMEPQRSSFTIAGGPSLSNGYGPELPDYGSSLYKGNTLGSVPIDTEDIHNNTVKTISRGDRGLAGLQNLGNTCFMNSALQCLVHTPPLVDYFLQDYADEINKQNPLGMHGELAVAFGELLRKLWSSGRSAVPPRAFKGKLARFAPQFSGYNQHDSQELLAFLLDGLHEDLNRVKQKPYFETKDYDGRPDEEVADEFWRYHKARNDSIVVDVCQGQYKSTLVCPECDKISITFDPFMYLSLPLPSTATRSMAVTVFYGDGSSLPMPFTVTVSKHGYCKDLFQALTTACCVGPDETLVLAEVYEHHIYRYLDSGDSLPSIKDDECIVAYRFSKKQAEFPKLEICHRYLEQNSKPGERKKFLTPLVTYLENAKTGTDIELAVTRVLGPLKRKAFSPTNKTEGIKVNNGFVEESTSESQMDSDEKEKDPCAELAFQLCITDERGYGCKPIFKDSVIKPGKIVKIMLDWSEKEHEVYDANYLKDLPVVHKPGGVVKKTKQESISLFSCLDAFLKEEPLGPDDMWYCPGCKEHRQASKKLDLWRLPDIIVFHLKRFSYSRFLKNKLDTFVNFPIHDLDLSKYVKSKDPCGGSNVYELYAISNHYGGLGGGHYSAYAKLVEEDRWYHFDDAHVTPVSEADIRTSAAYLLFYQRVKDTKSNGPESSGVHEDF